MSHFDELRKPFEESLAATLALDLDRNDKGWYTSPKTANLFLAFCYGWKKGEGDLMALPALLRELRHRN